MSILAARLRFSILLWCQEGRQPRLTRTWQTRRMRRWATRGDKAHTLQSTVPEKETIDTYMPLIKILTQKGIPPHPPNAHTHPKSIVFGFSVQIENVFSHRVHLPWDYPSGAVRVTPCLNLLFDFIRPRQLGFDSLRDFKTLIRNINEFVTDVRVSLMDIGRRTIRWEFPIKFLDL